MDLLFIFNVYYRIIQTKNSKKLIIAVVKIQRRMMIANIIMKIPLVIMEMIITMMMMKQVITMITKMARLVAIRSMKSLKQMI